MPQMLVRQTFRLFVVILLLSGARSGVSAQQQPADVAITHVSVVDVRSGRVLPDRTVTIAGGAVVAVAPSTEARVDAARTVDGRGQWLIPGLWDMHAHLRANGMPAAISTDWVMPLEIANGVTGVREMSSDCESPSQGPVCLPEVKEWRDRVEAGSLMGPRLMAISTFPVNPPWDYEVKEEQMRGIVDHFAEQGVDFIKIYDRLGRDALLWLADEARARDLDFAGHVPLRVTSLEASEAGFRSVEHARDFLFDCYPGTAEFRATTRSNSAPVAEMRRMVDEHDDARCEEIFAAFVRNGTAYVPTHVTRRMEAFADDSAFRHDPRMRYLPTVLAKAWLDDADRVVARSRSSEGRAAYVDFYRKGLEITGAAHRAGVRVLVGTDGGDSFVFPGFAVHDEMGELVKAGFTPAEALRAATLAGAEFLGVADRYGTVEEGKAADLVLLDANPLDDVAATRRIRAVVFRGELLDRAALDALLERAEGTAASFGDGGAN